MALWDNTDTANDKPKYLSAADKAATVGVDTGEATLAANVAKGLNTPGWVKYSTYTDAQGNTRHKSEVLVAMSSISGDAADDAIAADPVISISAQPAPITVPEGATATFSVTATVNNGVTPTYQWEKSDDNGATWTAIAGATSAEYVTAATVFADDDQDQYRVVISSTGAQDVTSAPVILTVTP